MPPEAAPRTNHIHIAFGVLFLLALLLHADASIPVPQSFSKPEPFPPGKLVVSNTPCPCLLYVPARASHHGADSEFVVPVGGPQSAAVHEHSEGGLRTIAS
jgi:hypothetical protein